jgi:hypothetical protein
MSVLLGHVTAWMRTHGMPLSILWGDRMRYARFGWDVAGARLAYSFSRRHARALAGARERVVRLSDPAARAAELHALHRELPVRVERSAADFPKVLRKIGRTVFAAARGGRLAAYVLAKRESWDGSPRGWSVEEAAGSAAGVLSLHRHLLTLPRIERVRGVLPLAPLPWTRSLLAAVDGWRVGIVPMGQIKVVDRAAVLSALGAAPVGSALARLAPDPAAEARLLFGPAPAALQLPPGRTARVLAGILPLPLFLWPSDHV